MSFTRVLLLTALAMIAFATNSLLCRAALRDTRIDAASFTLVRVSAGALMLCLIAFLRASRAPARTRFGGSWPSAFALFVYAVGFSFAYRTLPAGAGALLLFGAVQATMIFWGLRRGERLIPLQLLGLALALGGLVALVFPGISAPPLGGSLLMLSAGVAWGVYSLRGQGVTNPTGVTAGNFVRAVPFALLVSLAMWSQAQLDAAGLTCAIISGAITSGIGYVIWYGALPGLRATTAASVQLSVPVLAATGGILLLHEPISVRYLFASSAVLGGIALVILEKRPVRT